MPAKKERLLALEIYANGEKPRQTTGSTSNVPKGTLGEGGIVSCVLKKKSKTLKYGCNPRQLTKIRKEEKYERKDRDKGSYETCPEVAKLF